MSNSTRIQVMFQLSKILKILLLGYIEVTDRSLRLLFEGRWAVPILGTLFGFVSFVIKYLSNILICITHLIYNKWD